MKGAASVAITDTKGLPVSNATVSGEWTGALVGKVTAVTNASGVAMLTSPAATVGTNKSAVLGVTNVLLTGYSYSASSNVKTTQALTWN